MPDFGHRLAAARRALEVDEDEATGNVVRSVDLLHTLDNETFLQACVVLEVCRRFFVFVFLFFF